MLKYFSIILLGFSVAELNKCKDNFKCIPLSECEEIKYLIESNSLIDYMQSLSCGYFHEPYVCCARDCETPNGNYGRMVIFDNCTKLKENEFSTDLNKLEFLNDSFVNETHVCCGKNEDQYVLVGAAPIDTIHLPTDVLNLSCVTPNGDDANCTHIYDCPSYKEAAIEPNEYFHFINDSLCGYWKEPMVCCGNVSYYTELFADNLPEDGKCGLWNTTADNGIPPWLVLVSATKSVDVCVGALINQKYVVSTTLCTGRDYKKLSVRFGKCIGNDKFNTECIVKVSEMKLFPLQNFVRSDDIGVVLLKLSRAVASDGIPVCLSSSQLPIFQELEIVGLTKFKNTLIGDKSISVMTAFTDDCYFGTNLRYICMNGNSTDIILRKAPQQYMVLQLNKDRWYLEGVFNWRSWDESIANHFHAIYVHKFIPWIKSNIS